MRGGEGGGRVRTEMRTRYLKGEEEENDTKLQ